MENEGLKPTQVLKQLDLNISNRQLHSLDGHESFGPVLREESKTKSRLYNQKQVGMIAQQFSQMKLPDDFNGPMVFSVTQRKGGVAKTLLSFFMARQFAMHGIKTVVIGLDEQESITDLVSDFEIETLDDLKEYDSRKGLYHFIYEGEDLSKIVRQSDGHVNLYYIPETPELEELDDKIYLKESIRTRVFKDKLIPKLSEMGFQAIIFDCPPSLKSLLTKNSLVAANHIVMPIACDTGSFRGFNKGIAKFEEFKRKEAQNKHVDWKNVFYIPTKLRKSGKGATLSGQIYENVKEQFGAKVTSPIKFADIFEKSNNMKLLPIELKHSDSNAKQLHELIVDIFRKVIFFHSDSVGKVND